MFIILLYEVPIENAPLKGFNTTDILINNL